MSTISTFCANLDRHISNRDSLELGGGVFTTEELKEVRKLFADFALIYAAAQDLKESAARQQSLIKKMNYYIG